jgi:ABC-type nitrate/sulfonate/bicarbonate transport system substrate-binding protein
MRKRLLLICGVLCIGISAGRAEDMVRAAEVRSIGSGATLTAIDRGYFKDQGIKVELDAIDSSANAIALLAQSRYQIIEGGSRPGISTRSTRIFRSSRWRTAPRRRSATT